MERALWLRLQGSLTMDLFDDRVDRFGLDRYSTEHWVASSPDVVPCDMAPHAKMKQWLLHDNKDAKANDGASSELSLQWSMGPRHAGAPFDNRPYNVTEHWQATTGHLVQARMREYYLFATGL